MNNKSEISQLSQAARQTAHSEDDFVFSAAASKRAVDPAQHERRLHLRAFDYWHGLSADQEFPLFTDLTPQGLSPFKDNCLLLAFTAVGAVVRFCGAQVKAVLGGDVGIGVSLDMIADNEFAAALAHRFQSYEGRTQAAEFEFVEQAFESRGIMLPFSARGDGAQFAMVVVNYRKRAATETLDMQAIAAAADTCAQIGAAVVHPDNTSRQGLYAALAQAYAFHIQASHDPSAYRNYLRSEGLSQQRRAPYTPALKLTFGLDYDKTRITEYAAALSCAARSDISPEGLVDFLNSVPGGIKGCVKSERRIKRGGKAAAVESDDQIRDRVRRQPALGVEDIQLDTEFGLALLRRRIDGSAEVIAPIPANTQLIERLIREMLAKHDRAQDPS